MGAFQAAHELDARNAVVLDFGEQEVLVSFWKMLFGRRRKPVPRLPLDWICRDTMGITDAFRVKPATSPRTAEMMASARRKVDQSLEAEMVREVARLCGDAEMNGALARSAAVVRVALLKAELGIGSPEQLDLPQIGPAGAEGDSER